MHRHFRIILFVSLVSSGALFAAPAVAAPAEGKAASAEGKAPTKSASMDSKSTEKADKNVLVNGIAAEVAGKPLSLEDVYFHRALDRVKNGELGLINIERGDALKNSVQKLVLEEMVYGEMRSLNFDGGPKSEAVKLLQDRKKNPQFRSEWDKALAYFRVSDEKAVVALWKSLQVDKFIERKVETLTPLLTPDVVDRHLVANTPGFQTLPDSKKAELRQRADRLLKKERMGEQLREWVLRLKRKYSVVQYI